MDSAQTPGLPSIDDGLPKYLEYIRSVAPPLPMVQVWRSFGFVRRSEGALFQIEFEDLSYSVEVPVLKKGVEDIGTAVTGMFDSHSTKSRAVLTKCSGILSPGTLTLVRLPYLH